MLPSLRFRILIEHFRAAVQTEALFIVVKLENVGRIRSWHRCKHRILQTWIVNHSLANYRPNSANGKIFKCSRIISHQTLFFSLVQWTTIKRSLVHLGLHGVWRPPRLVIQTKLCPRFERFLIRTIVTTNNGKSFCCYAYMVIHTRTRWYNGKLKYVNYRDFHSMEFDSNESPERRSDLRILLLR